MTGQSDSEFFRELLFENTGHLEAIRNRVGSLPSSIEVEFICEMSDKASALEARMKLIEILPPKKGRHIYVMSTDGDIELKVIDVLHISPEAITEVEAKMLGICRQFGGTEVFWEFESTNAEE